jgi:hypothetical protein
VTPALWKKNALIIVGVFALIQLIPYGRRHENPPVRKEPSWDSPETRALAVRACFDCHSNLTVWPGYAQVAPLSWVITHHVDEGREHLNFSEWDKPQKDADEAAKAVREGDMPMLSYLPLHPDARLTDSEERALVSGLEKTLGTGHAKSHDAE